MTPFNIPAALLAVMERNALANAIGLDLGQAPFDHQPLIRFHVPLHDAQWLLTEYNPDTQTFFGLVYCTEHHEHTLGHVTVARLAAIRGFARTPVEYDAEFRPDRPLSSYCDPDDGYAEEYFRRPAHTRS
ncbi:DUF2958 domain-containing protein [Aminobacter sp. MET-1]|uniref:DUF2958 domain-containing protein n=1 Tax=Aminobacter sp. MET-1 TaxID=2951085 RepID=UPI00226A145B|nr:DUF2958 domain-containing protein [Aminobacter sp. MET-1]MCX8571160.1 DUF2958 domain-containing protein [Aminobacter sp. MET-1]MCX8573342.1 DUF2958 domain-containing protein [Aminobacter sp. MET-1]